MERGYKSPVVQRMMDEMKKDPWYVKLKRCIRVKIWVYICLSRKYWDISLESCIWNRFRK